MSSTDTVDRTQALEAKIDLLTEQMAVLTAEAEQRRRQREAFTDLTEDLSRVSGEAMAMATNELEQLTATADLQDTVRLVRRLIEVAPTLDRTLATLDQVAALMDDVVPLGTDAMALATERLADAERRGYFAFARAGMGVVDNVVTNFEEDDLVQLGDNVVTILGAVKEITQPEMLALLTHMVEAVRRQQERIDAEPEEAPSLWALARAVGDPDVRRGIGRALGTLRSVSLETGPESAGASADRPANPTSPQGEQ